MLVRNYTETHQCTFSVWVVVVVLFCFFFSLFSFFIANSFPNATLTKSFSTKKEERSTKTHVGIMKNTAWHPSMFSNRR